MTPSPMVRALDVNELAQEIRRVDGNHSLGAGALAEALLPFIRSALAPAEPVGWQWKAGGNWYTADKPSIANPEAYARAQASGGPVRPIYTSPVPATDAVREALRNLETACERLAATRSQAAYDAMIAGGQSDDLIALDKARSDARRALSPATGERAYVPSIVHFPEADRTEFVATDEAHVYAEDVTVQAVRSMHTRELRGFAWYGKEPPAPGERDAVTDDLDGIARVVWNSFSARMGGEWPGVDSNLIAAQHCVSVAKEIASLRAPMPEGWLDHPFREHVAFVQDKLALLPCPHCGAKMVRSDFHSTRRNDVFVHPNNDDDPCINDGVLLNREDRVAAWNRRATTVPPDVRGLVERLQQGHRVSGIGPRDCAEIATALLTLSASAEADLARLKSELEQMTRERDEAQRDLVAAWNAFGPSTKRANPPPFDVDDLDHLPLSADGDLAKQIVCLEDRAEAAEASLADARRVIERANDRLPSIETPMMGGDNLAILLCSFFDDGDPETEDDTGWSQKARDGYAEVISAIREHYSRTFLSQISTAKNGGGDA